MRDEEGIRVGMTFCWYCQVLLLLMNVLWVYFIAYTAVQEVGHVDNDAFVKSNP